nr:zinc ribbon domain-containing protein [Gammaproteobacteria bacterium]NIX54537.1 zinc ribbon domain-containing protein [candidate division Zixibacteria bacterium]
MSFVSELFLGSEERINPFIFGGRVLVYIIFLVWGIMFITEPMGSLEFSKSFMHNINLVFHEAGHIIFSIFGRLIKSLGGTLGQVLIPVIVTIAFLLKQNPFGATVGLWWTGQSLMDIAPYINDARAQRLILLGGVTGRDAPRGFHDWNFILGELGLLKADHAIA